MCIHWMYTSLYVWNDSWLMQSLVKMASVARHGTGSGARKASAASVARANQTWKVCWKFAEPNEPLHATATYFNLPWYRQAAKWAYSASSSGHRVDDSGMGFSPVPFARETLVFTVATVHLVHLKTAIWSILA